MANTGFKITDVTNGWNKADFNDVFINKDCFIEGNLWGWGFNDDGRAGNNSTLNISSPVQTVSGGTNWRCVNTYGAATLAIKSDGSLWAFGENNNGELGINNRIFRSSPVQTVSGGTSWKSIGKGYYHSSAIKTDGTLWTWGLNTAGQLGNNTSISASSPIQTVSIGTNWKQVDMSRETTAAIKTDGTLWLWGANLTGQLGDNTATNKSSPVQTASGGTNWKQIAVATFHSAAIKTDGTLWTWGSNLGGLLGNGLTINLSSPVQTIAGGANWKQVNIGCCHSAAIKTDGTLWIWGSNSSGRLGDGTTIFRSSPVQTVSGGTNWKSTYISGSMSSAIKTDGTLWMWGANNNGQLGISNRINASSPVQTITAGTTWRSVSAGAGFASAIKDI